MIPATDISLNDALVEVGHASGTQHEIGALLNEFDTYSTGASHSANSFKNMAGFQGGNIWHYLSVYSGRPWWWRSSTQFS